MTDDLAERRESTTPRMDLETLLQAAYNGDHIPLTELHALSEDQVAQYRRMVSLGADERFEAREAAERAERAARPKPLSVWRRDLPDLLPTVGMRTDGKGLFYPGKTHTVAAETGAGKDWLLLATCKIEMDAGHDVLYLDCEDDEATAIKRLKALGVSPEIGEAQFHYQSVREPFWESDHDDEDPNKEEPLLDQFFVFDDGGDGVSLVGLAGVTRAMRLNGLNPVGPGDISAFYNKIEVLAIENDCGVRAAVVTLDHLVLEHSSRRRYPIGGVEKLNAISGAGYILEHTQRLGIGRTGRAQLKLVKDRPGQIEVNAEPTRNPDIDWYGDAIFASADQDNMRISIRPPDRSEKAQHEEYKERVAKAITEHGPIKSKAKLEELAGGNRQNVRTARDELIDEGYVTEGPPYETLREYGEIDSE